MTGVQTCALPIYLDATFRNSIFYGDNGNVDDEIVVQKKDGANYNLIFKNILYKNKSAKIDALITDSFKNQSPEFENIDVSKGVFDFHLKSTSPAVDAALNGASNIDLDGKTRPVAADIGCYERQ